MAGSPEGFPLAMPVHNTLRGVRSWWIGKGTLELSHKIAEIDRTVFHLLRFLLNLGKADLDTVGSLEWSFAYFERLKKGQRGRVFDMGNRAVNYQVSSF